MFKKIITRKLNNDYKLVSGELDKKFYLNRYPDVVKAGYDPVEHYLNFGWKEGRSPNSTFDTAFYLENNWDIGEMNPFVHYLKYGKAQRRQSKARERQKAISVDAKVESNDIQRRVPTVYELEDENIIFQSHSFDTSFYMRRYPDVAKEGVDPITHYCHYGWREGRNPNEEFNTIYYLERYADVEASGMNPFVHWLQYGRYEGRLINKVGVSASQRFEANCPRIIFVSHEASESGAPAVLLSLLKWIKNNTYINFSIIVGMSGPWNSRFEALAPTFFMDRYQQYDLKQELRQFCGNHVQAVYLNTIAAAPYGEQLEFLQAEFITHVHEMESVFRLFELQGHVDILKRICRKFISVSRGCTQAIEKRFDMATNALHEIRPFIEEFQPDKAEAAEVSLPDRVTLQESRIFGCGAVETRKGFDLFCELAALLKQKGRKDFKAYWVGSEVGTDLDAVSVMRQYDVEDVMVFLGPCEYPRAYFAQADIFVLPSREDPYPLVCLEAADCGVPVVCFDERAGGMHTFVEDDAGQVLPFLDMAAMASALITLMDDPGFRQELGAAGRVKVSDRHYVDAMGPKILDLLPREVLLEAKDELSAYKYLIDSAKAVSFDIFDTLIVRDLADPHVAFDIIEWQHSRSEAAPLPLQNLRVNTAGSVLSSHEGEVDDVSIDEIYRHMPFYRNAELEKKTELALCHAHPTGVTLYNYTLSQGKPIYITSDMYLDAETVKAILVQNGVEHWDAFFLSSERGCKKDTGKLFEHVKQHLDISPDQILHLGDNWEGDVKSARQAGFVAARFAPLYERPHKLFEVDSSQGLSQIGRIWQSFSTQAARLWRETHPEQSSEFYSRLGFEVTGPLASMMAMHAMAVAKHHGAKRVVFLARDGRIVKKAFDLLYADDINKQAVVSDYLHLARSTVLRATLQHPLTSNDLFALMDGIQLAQKPVQHFLERSGLDITEPTVKKAMLRHFSSGDTIPSWPDMESLSQVFRELSALIHEANDASRSTLAAYMEQNNLLGDDDIVLVDVGWMLNIQSRVANFAKRQGSSVNIIGAYVGSRERADKTSQHESLLFKYGDPYVSAAFLEQHLTLFEVLFSAPEQPTKGLSLLPDGTIEPEFEPISLPPSSEFRVAQRLHFGAEAYFKQLNKACQAFFPHEISAEYFFQIFRSLVNTNNMEARAAFGQFVVSLGGHHEFDSQRALIEGGTNVEYVLKTAPEYFAPVFFACSDQSCAEVVIVTSAGLDNGSTRYRAIHLADSVNKRGIAAVLIHSETPVNMARKLIEQANTVVFQRCFREQGNVGYFLDIASKFKKCCLFDLDDLVLPDFIHTVGSVKGGLWDLDVALGVAESYEEMLKETDGCLVSTPVLKDKIEATYSIPVGLSRNKVMASYLKCPDAGSKPNTGDTLKLVYASGTYSHKEDFDLIRDLLYRFMKAHSDVSLSLVGHTQVGERLLALPNVYNYGPLSYGGMLDFIACHDLMLVPLVNNLFNHAKSNIKFVESGAVGVPVLASTVGEFARVIEHKRNGLLAENITDWKDSLEWARANRETVARIGSAVYSIICNSYTTTTLEPEARELLLRGKKNIA